MTKLYYKIKGKSETILRLGNAVKKYLKELEEEELCGREAVR